MKVGSNGAQDLCRLVTALAIRMDPAEALPFTHELWRTVGSQCGSEMRVVASVITEVIGEAVTSGLPRHRWTPEVLVQLLLPHKEGPLLNIVLLTLFSMRLLFYHSIWIQNWFSQHWWIFYKVLQDQLLGVTWWWFFQKYNTQLNSEYWVHTGTAPNHLLASIDCWYRYRTRGQELYDYNMMKCGTYTWCRD